MELSARYRGSLLGLAAGDALGTTLEFRQPGTFAPLGDLVGGGPFNPPAGAWTDDTSMALCLAESLVECGGFDPVDQLARYVRWYRHGHLASTGRCFDIGNTVRATLERFERSREPYCGLTAAGTAGNGSLMRLAPVALAWARRPRDAIRIAADSSRTTHAGREAVDACRYLSALLVGAVQGVPKDELLAGPFAVDLGDGSGRNDDLGAPLHWRRRCNLSITRSAGRPSPRSISPCASTSAA
jgi:ADP-ribosylglycohydrolase